MYSKNLSPVIQPVSDFPMPQPGLTRAAGILSYLNIARQGAHLPNAFVPNKVVTFSLSELVCSSYTFCPRAPIISSPLRC